MPKRPGRFKRAMKATGRGIARGARAVVKGTKVLAKRQLTKKEIEWAKQRNGKEIKRGNKTIYYWVPANWTNSIMVLITEKKAGHGFEHIETRHYTLDGKLESIEKSRHKKRSGYEERIFEPPGSFRHKTKRDHLMK